MGDENIDADLVTSIANPAQNPNAAEVFYRVITASGESMNSLLGRLHQGTRVLLLWGSKVRGSRFGGLRKVGREAVSGLSAMPCSLAGLPPPARACDELACPTHTPGAGSVVRPCQRVAHHGPVPRG